MVAEATEPSKSTSSRRINRTLMNAGAPALRLPFQRPRDDLSRPISIAGPVRWWRDSALVGWVVRAGTHSPEVSAANGVLLTVYFSRRYWRGR